MSLVRGKVSVSTTAAFKEVCAYAYATMLAEISRFIADYANSVAKRHAAPDYSTLRQRRKALNTMTRVLVWIRTYKRQFYFPAK